MKFHRSKDSSDVVMSKSEVSRGHSSLSNQMRQSQKREQQANRLSRIGLEKRKHTRARRTDYGEGKGMSVTITRGWELTINF